MRRVLSWLPAVLVVPAAMAGAVAVSAPDDRSAPMRALHPLDLGTTWVYRVTNDGAPSGTRTKQIVAQAGVGDTSLDAIALRSTYTDYPDAGVSDSTVYLGLEGDRLVQHGVYSEHEARMFDPPAPAYQLPARAGSAWIYDGTLGDAEIRSDVRLEAVEDVEVSGRTFRDCAHYVGKHVVSFGEQQLRETVEEWTCPDYGPVRVVDTAPALGLALVEELVEFHGRAGNWWAVDPQPETAEVAVGSTLGFDPARTRATRDGRIAPTLAWSEARNTDVPFPPVGDGRVRVLVESDGSVAATDRLGQVLWRVRLAAPVVTAPALTGSTVVVADAEKNVWALDADTGAARWVRHLDDVASAAPAVGAGRAVVATEDGAVTALDLATGEASWRVDLAAPSHGPPALADHRVVVADRSGSVTALNLTDGQHAWTRALEGALVSAPVLVDGLVLAADDLSVVYAWDLDDGALRWETLTDHVPESDLAAGSGTAVLRTSGDHLEALRLDDGGHAWTASVAPSRVAPVVVGEQAVGVSVDGLVEVHELADGSPSADWRLPLPTPGSAISVDMAIGLVDGAIVFGGDVAAEGQSTTMFGYPTGGSATPRGIAFGVDVRPVPSSATAAPALDGEILLVPAQDHSLYRSAGTTGADPVLASDGLLPGVVAAGGLAISQSGQEWQAVPIRGGDPVWTFPATDPLPGSLPAVGPDSVFVPVHGAGLAALDPATGATHWFHRLPGDVGGTTPVALADGDAIYASGVLARYDGADGAVRWHIEDVATFSTPAYDDGVVYVDAVRNLHPSGLAAHDAATGRRLWFHANADTQVVAGPGAGEGVVVYADAQGHVSAFDGRSGDELWQVRLRTPIAGAPLVRDGRVYLTEAGRDEDLFQRDFQVVAHDLRTGAFLGAFEPPGSGYVEVPSVGHGPAGELLVPSTSRLGPIVLVLEARP